MNGLLIGKAIKTILNGIKNVYPLVADKDTRYPFVVYRRSGLLCSSTKDRFNYQTTASVEIVVASDTYSESIQIAKEIIGKMEGTRGKYNDIKISEIKLTNAEEDFLEDAFVQKLTFNIDIL